MDEWDIIFYHWVIEFLKNTSAKKRIIEDTESVSYTHLRAHETVLDLVCRLLLEKKNILLQTHPRISYIRYSILLASV